MRPDRPSLLLLVSTLACAPSQEAAHVLLPVKLDGSQLADSKNDAGWTVILSAARIAVTDVQFTITGEMHGASASLGDWFIRRAWAHPGHLAGGEVTGELPGTFILDWFADDGKVLGTADMLTGDYNGINFTFHTAGAEDGLAAADPLLGHSAYFSGVAHRDGEQVQFTMALDYQEGTQMIGAPFDLALAADTEETIALQFLPTDPVEQRSMFDGVAFDALDDDGDGVVTIDPGSEAANVVRRAIYSHAHYQAEAQ